VHHVAGDLHAGDEAVLVDVSARKFGRMAGAAAVGGFQMDGTLRFRAH